MTTTLPAIRVDTGDVLIVRGERVMLDQKVAEAFGTET